MTYLDYILLYFSVATDWSKCVKTRATEIFEEIRMYRRAATKEANDIYDRERIHLADRWGFLHRNNPGSVTPKPDDVAPGNVFFYQEE